MKKPRHREDFPAAHSMDSGWFAIDKTGALALFDTGEPGAMPINAVHTTGLAGDDDDDDEFARCWLDYLKRAEADPSLSVGITSE